MSKNEIAVFGGGCFWCTEAIFKQVKGVISVIPGYAGGWKADPTYHEVCNGDTGHAEVIRVEYDSQVITYKDLLEVFWLAHDPTTLNRQGNDIGEQYRSVIFYSDESQKTLAEFSLKSVNQSGRLSKPATTLIQPLATFYPAEEYHQDYFNRNPDQPYCYAVISPKLKHFLKIYTRE